MALAIKKAGNKYAVHKATSDGAPEGTALQVFETLEQAQALAGATKCYDEEWIYVPWTATTLADALDAQEAQEHAKEVSEVARMYKQLVDRVLENPDVKDKPKAIISLAEEYAKWLENPDEKKSVPLTRADVADHSIIKSIGTERIGGYAVLWGDADRKDLTDQYFTTKTAELTAIFDAVGRLPWMYHHALDGTVKTKVAGVVDVLNPDSIGMWYEAQLKMADEYDQYIKKLLEAGRLKTSSQTFASALEYNKKTGEITRWPIVEITGTPTPAEYRMPAIEFLKSAYADIGVSDFTPVANFQREEPRQRGAEKARLELEFARLQLI